jgi:obg-like ATPase 1
MPPKKGKEAPVKKVLLGRPGKSLSMGLVGLPNVGKSSTFNVLSNLSVPAENYPFCTIEPSEARVAIPDKRYEKLCEMYSPASKVPAAITIFDIAGLVKGASTGSGLGNNFLAEIRAVDGIYHVVRAFDDPDVLLTEGDEVNPERDMEIITDELMAKDSQILEKTIEDLETKIKKKETKELKKDHETALLCRQCLADKKPFRNESWDPLQTAFLNT